MLTDGPDHLLVIIGDHARDGWSLSANRSPALPDDPGSHLGKLIRVNIKTGETETLTLGHRNPQGLARDKDGNLWATEHGPQGGDELNLLELGGNYGWPHVTYGVNYGRSVPEVIEFEKVGWHDGFAAPVFSWVPSPATTAIVINDEQWFPLWGDDLLIASLRAKSLFRVRRLGRKVQYVEQVEIDAAIRDLAWMPDGRLALLYPWGANNVAFLSRSKKYCDEDSRHRRDVYAVGCESDIADHAVMADHAKRLYGRHCSSCHGLDLEQHGDGPSLSDVIGRRAGSVDGYDFSDVLGSLDHVWTRDSLVRFLVNPQSFAPGTSMSELSITEEEARTIVDFIGDRSLLMKLLGSNLGDYRRIIQADFNVYHFGDKFVYLKAPCGAEDIAPRFFLHLVPKDRSDLPDKRKRFGFDNRDFSFADRTHTFADEACGVMTELPEYPIEAVRTGQFTQDADDNFHNLWERNLDFLTSTDLR